MMTLQRGLGSVGRKERDMAVREARVRIAQEFMDKFYEWLDDLDKMPDYEYGRKYGWQKSQKAIKDNLKGVTTFQKYIFSGRWLPQWERAGYDKSDIWELSREKFLSNVEYSNWEARQTGRTSFYFISQARAKEIYKAYKSGRIEDV